MSSLNRDRLEEVAQNASEFAGEMASRVLDLESEVGRLREALHEVVSEAQTMHDLVRHLIQRPPSTPEAVQERARDILRRCGPDEAAPLHARIDARGLDALNGGGDSDE